MTTDLYIVGSGMAFILFGSPMIGLVLIMLNAFGYVAEADRFYLLFAVWMFWIIRKFLKFGGTK